jgi:excisionase family DNA binding protein
MAELLMSVSEASILTGWSTDLLYDLIRKNQIPFVRAGTRKISIPKAAFEKWMTEKAFSNMNMKRQRQEKPQLQIAQPDTPLAYWQTRPGCGGRKKGVVAR